MTTGAAGHHRGTMPFRRPVALLLALLVLGLAGCGGSDDIEGLAEGARQELREQERKLRDEVRERTERLRERIERVLDGIERAVPRARQTSPDVQGRGRTETGTVADFLTDIIRNVDGYWTKTFAASGLPEPRVSFAWVPAGGRARTACEAVADDNAAFYCPADDTIYIAERFAASLHDGVLRGLPGERSGGRAAGDFGVAYVVAHEYAHNLQAELDLFRLGRANSSKAFELQADCMAGLWGNSVYVAGQLAPGDIEEALGTALAVGDFDVSSANHHGTPSERRAAWLDGFERGDPSVCARYVPTV